MLGIHCRCAVSCASNTEHITNCNHPALKEEGSRIYGFEVLTLISPAINLHHGVPSEHVLFSISQPSIQAQPRNEWEHKRFGRFAVSRNQSLISVSERSCLRVSPDIVYIQSFRISSSIDAITSTGIGSASVRLWSRKRIHETFWGRGDASRFFPLVSEGFSKMRYMKYVLPSNKLLRSMCTIFVIKD